MDYDTYTKFWRRALSAVWWFKLPIVPYSLYAFIFTVIIYLFTVLFTFVGVKGSSIYLRVVDNLLTAVATLVAMWLLFRFFERRKMRQAGFDLQKAGPDLLVGFGLGIILVSTMVAILWFLGVYEIVHFTSNFEPIPMLLMYFFAAVTEEVIFRAFVFQTAEIRLGTRWAFIISCVLFGLVHLVNNPPGMDVNEQLWACFCLIFEAGIVLNGAFLVRRTVWLPIGLHWAWNFFEGPIYGMTVSGTPRATQLIDAHLLGDKLLTGGGFGPEASITGFAVGTLSGIAMLYYVSTRDKVKKETPIELVDWKKKSTDDGRGSS